MWFEWILAFLPRRFRGSRYIPPAAAILSGVVELLLCLVLLIYRYFIFNQEQNVNGELMTRAAAKGGETAVMGSGLFTLINYVFQPITLLIIYFLGEGIARIAAAIASGEVLPTLPLALFDLGREKKKKISAEIALGSRIPDEVETLTSGEDELKISSCREKVNWDQFMTIAFNDQLYEVSREVDGQPPRRFVYYLRKKPQWKVVRGMHHYSPDEVMNKE